MTKRADIIEFTSSDFERLLNYPNPTIMFTKIHKELMALESVHSPMPMGKYLVCRDGVPLFGEDTYMEASASAEALDFDDRQTSNFVEDSYSVKVNLNCVSC